jgi:hypothetical protein
MAGGALRLGQEKGTGNFSKILKSSQSPSPDGLNVLSAIGRTSLRLFGWAWLKRFERLELFNLDPAIA